MRLAHISDTHFGTEEAPVVAALREDILRAAPEVVVLTGDITQRARAAQFRAARAFLDSLAPIPVLVVPGNHDQPIFDLLTRFLAPYRYYRRYMNRNLAPLWQAPDVAVVGVNSTRLLRHKHGALPPEAVRSVAAQLTGLHQPFKVVALHHPLAVVEADDLNNLARGGAEALAAWAAAGADLILGGHIHLPYCIAAGPAGGRAIVLQAGTAVSWRRRGLQSNSYNLVHFHMDAPRCMEVEQRDYDRAAGCFFTQRARRARAGESGWGLDTEKRAG